jgi:hypothetical protein
MKAVSLSLICSIFLFVGTIVSGSNGASLRSNEDNDQRTLQSSDTVIRTDLVRLIPFDVQIAIQDDSSSTSSEEVIESLYPLLTDTITDWMMESFEIKTMNPNTQLVNNNTSFDSIALELTDQTSSKGTIDGQILSLVQVSFEGVSLWERVGTGTPPMEPDIVELVQRATFLEDKKLKDDLQITINTLLIDLGMYEDGSEEQSPILIVDVRAYITPTGTGSGYSNGNNDGNSNNGSGNIGAQQPSNTGNPSLEIIIIVAIVVACLAFALLIFAVIWAWRSDRRDNHYVDKPSQGQGGTERAVSAVGGGSKSSKQQQQQRKSNKSSNKSATSNSSSNRNKKVFGGGKQNRNSSATQKQRGGGGGGGGGRNSRNNKYDNNNNDDDPGAAGVTDFPDILNNGSYPKEIGNVDGNDTDDYDDSVVNGGTDNQYPGDSVVSEDISSSLTAYYKSGMGCNNNQGGGNQPRHHIINDRGGGGDDGASLSSMDSYGYSLDGYAPSLGPAQGGYPVGPLHAAKDAPIPIGDSMDEIGHMDIVQLQQEEESVADYDAEPTPSSATTAESDEA